MIYLPDVNIWVALTSDKHVHHLTARNWLQNLGMEQIAFCRITELGFLRLLTNRHVMNEDVLDPMRGKSMTNCAQTRKSSTFLSKPVSVSIGDRSATKSWAVRMPGPMLTWGHLPLMQVRQL
jgi:predicted nucleic acid-binding protein